jgi:hypothetical protein
MALVNAVMNLRGISRLARNLLATQKRTLSHAESKLHTNGFEGLVSIRQR